MSQYDDRVGVHNLDLTPKEKAEKERLKRIREEKEKQKRDALRKKQQGNERAFARIIGDNNAITTNRPCLRTTR